MCAEKVIMDFAILIRAHAVDLTCRLFNLPHHRPRFWASWQSWTGLHCSGSHGRVKGAPQEEQPPWMAFSFRANPHVQFWSLKEWSSMSTALGRAWKQIHVAQAAFRAFARRAFATADDDFRRIDSKGYRWVAWSENRTYRSGWMTEHNPTMRWIFTARIGYHFACLHA